MSVGRRGTKLQNIIKKNKALKRGKKEKRAHSNPHETSVTSWTPSQTAGTENKEGPSEKQQYLSLRGGERRNQGPTGRQGDHEERGVKI